MTFLPVGWVNNAAYRLAAGNGAATMIARAEQQAGPLAVCHTDLHAGNVLVGPDDRISIVDLIDDFSTNREYERYSFAQRIVARPHRAKCRGV